jgi:formate hydrogenlyase subunit 4
MKNLTLLNLASVLIIIVPMLLGIAFMTIIERKQLAAHQRRVGPQVTGYFGVLQPLLKKISERQYFYFFNGSTTCGFIVSIQQGEANNWWRPFTL